MGLLRMKYLVAISYNILIIDVHLCWMHVWTCFLVEKSQYHASLISFWVFLFIYKYLGSHSVQMTKFWDICPFKRRKQFKWFFFLQRYFMFKVDISAKKGLAGNISWMWTLWDDVLPSGSRCGMWGTCRLVCLLWPSPQPRLSWDSPPACSTRWSFVHMCFPWQKALSNEVSPVLGRGNLYALVVGQDLCGLMSQLDLTAMSRFCWLKKTDVSCHLFGLRKVLWIQWLFHWRWIVWG